jgi:hypothetical protein
LHQEDLGRDRLPVQHIHTYLVHAGKGVKQPPKIGGASVALEGKLYGLLNDIYVASERECDIDISFSPTKDGKPQNPCRDLILSYLSNPTLANGRSIAERLEKVTDKRSGLGLLFLIAGKEGRDHKIVLSRFPTDSAILADENLSSLVVEFLERVFMKSKHSYKAVIYRDASLRTDFWTGRAFDKQINTLSGESSDYWIADFLQSDFRLTPAAGTRRLATTLRAAAKKADLDVKTEIIAATRLAGGLKGQRISIVDFADRFGLSAAAKEAIVEELKMPAPSCGTVQVRLGRVQLPNRISSR